MPKVTDKLTIFQKYILLILFIGLLAFLIVFFRQQEISRCKSFYNERQDKIEGKIDFLRFEPNFTSSYRWCDWILYGFRYNK